jgi:metal-responsive CopG/Arc/MetJ family transcriptional regulator
MQERVSVRLNPENLIDGFILSQPKGKRSKFLREAVRVYIQTLSKNMKEKRRR